MMRRRFEIAFTLFTAVAVFRSILCAQSNGVLREVYQNAGGGSIAGLTNHASFPNNPTFDEILTNGFEAPVDQFDNYGQRLRALVTAPVSGSYVFYIASDDQGELYVSSDETPAFKQRVAWVGGWTSSREWNKEANQKSAPITLTAGQRYYVEALQSEGGGGDNLAVGWQKPGDPPLNNGAPPIPNNALVPYGLGPPIITVQPANTTVVEGGVATFSLQLARTSGATYQWLRNGTNIPGANGPSYALGNVKLSDHNSLFHCFVTNPLGSTNSAAARLSVTPDLVRPTITAVYNLGDPQLLSVFFSELVEPASATNLANYALNNGASILGVTMGDDGISVMLRTTPLALGITYTLTVNNVRDRAQTPNSILPNTQKTVSLTYAPLDVSYITGTNESPGPSSRRGPLAITEIMFHPTNRPDGRNLEFIELFNSNPWTEDLSGFRLAGDVAFTFPPGTTIGPLSYRVVAAVPADAQAVYGLSGVLGPLVRDGQPLNTTNVLDNGGGTVRLRDRRGGVLLEAAYDDEPPYSAAADGAGHSLVLARPSFGERDPRAWAASDAAGGSPGTNETTRAHPQRTVLINEFLAHTDEPQLDFIELFNYGTNAVDLSGCWLTDDPTTNKFRIPTGTILPPRGFLSFDQTQLGFALDAAGEAIFLRATNGTRVLDAVRFGDQENGVATGRSPDGAPGFTRLLTPTPGTNNAPPRISDVVINEIMYHPPEGDAGEFVELYNQGASVVDLGKWRLRGGISYTFPTGTILPPGGYVVVAGDRTNLLATHPGLSPLITFGDFSGRLGNDGDTLTLDKPAESIGTNELGHLVTNKLHIVVDEVTYGTGGRWGRWSDGGGSSLELVDPRSDHRLAPNWADSDESVKSAWITLEHTGVLDHGMDTANSLQIFLLGPGECLVDDVEVIPAGGTNLVANSTFSAGLTGWVPQGNQEKSGLSETGGYGDNGRCLRLRATGRGDTGANRVRYNFGTSLSAGSTATLRMKVRWLSGCQEILMRLRGNYLEATTNILTTHALGTPGAPNSRAAANSPPAITDVSHSPALPAASQAVLVTARVHDPDGLSAVYCRYRIDPATNFTALPMAYSGAGFFSALLPAQAANTLIAFYIEARDNHAVRATARFPTDAPARECLVRWGDPAPPGNGTIGTYRFWITQATVNKWSQREKLSNDPLDATFVSGNRIIYNAGALYSGSPWHAPGFNSPVGNGCDYAMVFPKDDRWLGETELSLLMPGNGGGDWSAQRETHTYWIASELGLPFNYARHVNLFVNGQRRAQVYVDSQQPNREFLEQWFPDGPDGDLYKMAIWFEFDDAASGFSAAGVNMGVYTTTGGQKKLARYRWNWQKRAVVDSANNYTNLFRLIDTVNTSLTGDAYTAAIEALIDVDEWARIFAVEKLIGNWDSYGNGGGQNMYAAQPVGGRWNLLLWDIDFAFAGNNPDADMYAWSDAPLSRMFTHPPFQRIYYQALLDAVNGPLLASRSDAMLDARFAAFSANGLGPENPQAIKTYIATRRANILASVTNVVAPFAITSNAGADFATNRNLIALSGNAPLGVRTITVNGTPYRVTWSSVTNWTLRLALEAGVNALTLQGLDRTGAPVSGASDTIRVTFTGAAERPQDKLVINELMYHPLVPDTAFIELLNTSASNAFDLSNWRLEGLDGTIPDGTVIEPGQFLVFVKNRAAFAAAYGTGVPVAGEFAGSFDKGGETISLVQPGPTPEQNVVIDQVTYDDDPPWPAEADGTGPSLQLIDPLQDNNRVANWGVSPVVQTNTPETLIGITHLWRYEQSNSLDGVNWTAPAYNDSAWPTGRALLYVEGAALPAPKSTPLTLGRLTYYFRTHFTYTGVPGTVGLKMSTVIDDAAVFYLNGVEVYRLGMNAGPLGYATLAGRTIGDAYYEGPFTIPAGSLVQGDNVLAVEVHQASSGSSDIVFGMTLDTDVSAPPAIATPGAANSVRATLPPFPPVWLNEVLPNNVDGPADRFGEREPWVELYHGGSNVFSLANCYLTDTYSNLTKWPFPAGTVISNRQFLLVWLDGEPEESTTSELHANFRIPPDMGTLALVRSNNNQLTILDHLNFSIPSAGRSYGDYPDGNVSGRQLFSRITPGVTNDPTGAAIVVTINEWMADNSATLADPADGDYEDWFELYNPADVPVDLSGYFLTDTLTNKTKWEIPAGVIVPAHGHLLIWADSESNQNAPGRDPHTNFKLRASGQAIGLFAPGGGTIDAVTFGPQTADVSEGRFADGQPTIYAMTTPTPGAPNVIPQGNAPPRLDPLPNRTIAEGHLLTFTATATDTNTPAQTLLFSLDAGAPEGAVINPFTGDFSWVPSEAQGPGLYAITIRVTDNGVPAMSDATTFTVQVTEENSPPVLTPIGNRTLDEGATLTVNVSATDPDGADQSFTFSLDPGAPAGMVINPTNGVLTWTPSEAQGPAAYLVTVRVTDHGDPPASDTTAFSIVVNEVNAAPVIAPIPSQTNHLGVTYSFQVPGSDPDLPPNPLTYSFGPGAPPGATLTPEGLFTWTPTTPRTNVVFVRATDNGTPARTTSRSFTLVARAPLSVAAITRSASEVTLTWTAIPGRTYQPQFKTNLQEALWTNLGAPVPATGNTATVTDPLSNAGQKFYRIVVVD